MTNLEPERGSLMEALGTFCPVLVSTERTNCPLRAYPAPWLAYDLLEQIQKHWSSSRCYLHSRTEIHFISILNYIVFPLSSIGRLDYMSLSLQDGEEQVTRRLCTVEGMQVEVQVLATWRGRGHPATL